MKGKWKKTDTSFKAMIIGKLLGDGSITIQTGRKPRFQYTHTYSDFGWSNYCFKYLIKYLPLSPPKFKKTTDPRLTKGYSLAYYVQSRTSDIITYLRNEWYPNNLKIIPIKQIEKYFNEQSLAWWYMDDGHLKIENNTPQKIILSTESFTTQENQWLINFLFQRYTLKFKLDGQNRIVLYDQFQIYYFLFLITPYSHNSMYRKIVPSCKLHHDTTARRTTIYLPRTIKIHSPTKEINAALRNLNQIINDYKQGLFYEKYNDTLTNQSSVNNKSYQIIITSKNLTDLIFLSAQTGLTYSRLTALCFEQEFL